MRKKTTTENSKLKNWHSMEIDDVLKETSSNIEGLSCEEVNKRLDINGKNELPKKKRKNFFQIALKELINPIVLLLVVAGAFSFIIGEFLDGGVIVGIVIIDLVMGTVQQMKAEKIAMSLSSMIKHTVKVLRDGEKALVDSVGLVVGDIVFLESGDRVAADMRIIECSNLSINESILTGESINSEKSNIQVGLKASLGDRKNMAFAGTNVITGRAMCVVVETSSNTQIGSIATSINEVKDEQSPLDIRIKKFSKQITIMVVVVAVVIFTILMLKGDHINEIFLAVVALSVSAIPEGLPLSVTVALTIASNRMGKNNVVVKNLNSVESLGSCTVVATDKTGTLTINEQTAKVIILPSGEKFEISGSGYNDIGEISCETEGQIEFANEIALLGGINNEAKLYKRDEKFKSFGDSIDIAFLALMHKSKQSQTGFKVHKQIPYESENKFSAVFYSNGDDILCTAKGSLEKIISFCSKMKEGDSIVPIDIEKLEKQHEKLAKSGYRVITLAKTEKKVGDLSNDNLKNMVFLGMVGFIDPIRSESKSAVASCHEAGIKVVMITGDHPLTAFAIAKEIDIANNNSSVANGSEVEKQFALGQKIFDEFVKTKTVFSRVTPTDKFNIVESMKRQGEFVAVTGDGVNDAPAIKTAHIGIAMGSGTDVAKETADMIITDDNFNSIVSGIKEGRNAYSNIRKVTYMLLASAFAEILFFLVAIATDLPLPLLAIQLLWLNVITDGLQDLALSFEKAEKYIMVQKPRPTKESLFSKSLLKEVTVAGGYTGVLVLVCWILFVKVFNFDITYSRSMTMALMVFLQNFQALNCRSETQSLFKISARSNVFFVVSIVGATSLQILLMEVEKLSVLLSLTNVSYIHLLIIFGLALTIIPLMEIYKAIIRAKIKRFNNGNYKGKCRG